MDALTLEAQNKIWVALDVNTLQEAAPLVKELAPWVGGFKVASRLITAEGAPAVIQMVRSLGGRVILDLKFGDIPDQMAGAGSSAVAQHVDMFTIHASAGVDGMMATVNQRGSSRVLAVTVLTSLDEANAELIFGAPPKVRVLQFAREAMLAGVDGIVCSAQELTTLVPRPELEGLFFATPGIRPGWAQLGDQKRTTTPGEAVRNGARIVIIGRPILRPPSEVGGPVNAVRQISEEIAAAMKEKATPTTEEEVLGLLTEVGAILNGHFVLTSGKHSDQYVLKDRVTAYPKTAARVCRSMAELARQYDAEVVVGPALGGIVFAHWVAEWLTQMTRHQILSVYTEKSSDGKTPLLSRGFGELVRGKRVLLVEDILTTGGSARAVGQIIREAGGDPQYLVAMWNRGGVSADEVGVQELRTLVSRTMKAWTPSECPMCAQGIPVNQNAGHGRDFLAQQQK